MYKTYLIAIVFIPLAKLFLLLIYKTNAEKLFTVQSIYFFCLQFSNTYDSDPIWSEWEKGVCSKACLGGSRTDKRVCIHGNCEGASEITVDCNDRTCKGILIQAHMYI